MRPLVSVCVVTYNHAAYIRQCLESVLKQEGDFELEILVGDDKSTDETGKLVAEMAQARPESIRAYSHDLQLGAAGNVRFLMSRARGDFLAHLDGDDAWLPGKLARQLAMFDRYPEAVAAYCNALVVEAGGEGVVLGKFSDAASGLVTLGHLMACGNFLNNSSLVFREGARPALMALPAEYLDYRSHLTLALIGPLAYSAEPLVIHRWSTTGSLVRKANLRVRELYWQAIAGVPDGAVDVAVRRAGHADFLRRVLFRSLRTFDGRLWLTWWARVRKQSPKPAWRLFAAVVVRTASEVRRQVQSFLFARSPERRIFYFEGAVKRREKGD